VRELVPHFGSGDTEDSKGKKYLLRSQDNEAIGRLATGWSVVVDEDGLLVVSDDVRRSTDAGVTSVCDDNDAGGGLVSTGETSVLTGSWTGSDGWFDVGRGGVLGSSDF